MTDLLRDTRTAQNWGVDSNFSTGRHPQDYGSPQMTITQAKALTAERLRCYANGYAAGRRKIKAGQRKENARRERQAFWDRAFITALPVCFAAQGWERGDLEIMTLEDRVQLAVDTANEAVKRRRVVA